MILGALSAGSVRAYMALQGLCTGRLCICSGRASKDDLLQIRQVHEYLQITCLVHQRKFGFSMPRLAEPRQWPFPLHVSSEDNGIRHCANVQWRAARRSTSYAQRIFIEGVLAGTARAAGRFVIDRELWTVLV